MESPSPWHLPLRIRRVAEAYVVEDAAGVTLAYVYIEADARIRSQTRRLSPDAGEAMARLIARAVTGAGG